MHVMSCFHKEYLLEKLEMIIKLAMNIEFVYEPLACLLMNFLNWCINGISDLILNCDYHFGNFILFRLFDQISDCSLPSNFKNGKLIVRNFIIGIRIRLLDLVELFISDQRSSLDIFTEHINVFFDWRMIMSFMI